MDRKIAERSAEFHGGMAHGISIMASVIDSLKQNLEIDITSKDMFLIIENLDVVLPGYIVATTAIAQCDSSEELTVSDIIKAWEEKLVVVAVVNTYMTMVSRYGHVQFTKEMVNGTISSEADRIMHAEEQDENLVKTPGIIQ